MYRRRPTNHPFYSIIFRGKYAAAALIAACLTISGCSLLPVEDQALKPPLIEPAKEQFDIVEAAKGNIQTYLKGTASFVSGSVGTLSFKESGGRLKAIHIKLGEEVRTGDLLVELETGDLELQLELQRLSVERAQLLYRQAKMTGVNATDLRLREIDLQRETLTLQAMEKRYKTSRLYAPISGIVTFIETLNTGDNINAYQPIVTVADPTSMQLTYVAGNAKDLLPVEVGMPVSLKYKGKDYKGRVLQSPASAPVTADKAKTDRNAATIIMSMEGAPEGVHVGDVAEMTIELQKRENVIVLPRSAVRSYMGRSYVQIQEGERRKEVDVEVGLTTPTEVEIVHGLEAGRKVVLSN